MCGMLVGSPERESYWLSQCSQIQLLHYRYEQYNYCVVWSARSYLRSVQPTTTLMAQVRKTNELVKEGSLCPLG